MTPLAIINQAVRDTVLDHLALLFLAGAANDTATARQAASEMLAAYNVGSDEELRLAAEIISFGFRALQALGQAAAPALSLDAVLGLHGSAVSLSREGHKSQRKLDQLQRARRPGAQSRPSKQQAAAVLAEPAPEPAKIHVAPPVPVAKQVAVKPVIHGKGQTWTQMYHQRQSAKRIAKNLEKNRLKHLAQSALATASAASVVAAAPLAQG